MIARACAETALDPAGPTTVELPLLGLPACVRSARALDLAIVVDTSLAMRSADLGVGGSTLEALVSFLEAGFSSGSRFTVVTHGDSGPGARADSDDPADAVGALRGLEGSYAGDPRPYASLVHTARLLRDRATCARRPCVSSWSAPEPRVAVPRRRPSSTA
jgi:hypothetical protein